MCSNADVRAEGPLDPRWSDAVARLCDDLQAMKDRDPDARVRLTASAEDVLVEVTLPDGRGTIRRVRRPHALRDSLEALLTLPPERRDPEPPRAAVSTVAAPPPPEPAPLRTSPFVGAEIALGVGGRVAGSSHLALGGAAEAYLIAGHWLFGLWARWDAFQRVGTPSDVEVDIDTVGAGVTFARRYRLGSSAELDVGVVPRLIVENQRWERDARPGSPVPEGEGEAEDEEGSRTTTDVRVATLGRVHFGRGPLRPFVGIDAEVSPARLRRPSRAAEGIPALPAWSAGLIVGVSWTGL